MQRSGTVANFFLLAEGKTHKIVLLRPSLRASGDLLLRRLSSTTNVAF